MAGATPISSRATDATSRLLTPGNFDVTEPDSPFGAEFIQAIDSTRGLDLLPGVAGQRDAGVPLPLAARRHGPTGASDARGPARRAPLRDLTRPPVGDPHVLDDRYAARRRISSGCPSIRGRPHADGQCAAQSHDGRLSRTAAWNSRASTAPRAAMPGMPVRRVDHQAAGVRLDEEVSRAVLRLRRSGAGDGRSISGMDSTTRCT